MDKLQKFRELGLSEASLEALDKKGFEEPTSIQKRCIPLLLKNKINVMGQAQTGTGKTAAFGLPIIEMVDDHIRKVQALIIVPTRELAIQVSEEINSFKGSKKLMSAAVYGGQSIVLQFRRIDDGAQIIVGTPGRLNDLIRRNKLKLENLKFLVLDEADEMLNMGFIEDIETILEHTPKDKRMLLFSATMPTRILGLAKKYMGEYEYVQVKAEQLTTNLTDQIYFEVNGADKLEALSRIIDIEPDFYGLVFCRTRSDVDMVTSKLIGRGYKAEGIHGDIAQNQREKTFARFKRKDISILVATDVAARGISVDNLTHVINYSLPQDSESYVHRIGRTGRAGKEGTAITFITPSEYRSLVFIQRTTKTEIRKEKVPQVEDIIRIKKERIINDIKAIISESTNETFEKLSEEIIKDNDPKKIIAALLKYSFKNELEESSYNKIQEPGARRQISVDAEGTSRLFIAIGKNSGMTQSKLADYITKKTGVKKSAIQNIEVFNEFSFASVPFREAEIIIAAFKKMGNGKRSLVTKARKGR